MNHLIMLWAETTPMSYRDAEELYADLKSRSMTDADMIQQVNPLLEFYAPGTISSMIHLLCDPFDLKDGWVDFYDFYKS